MDNLLYELNLGPLGPWGPFGPFGPWTVTITAWKLVGYLGVFLFAGRWFVQMWASRIKKRPVVPRLFWYMSIVGSGLLLSYFIFGKNDSVGIMSNLFPATVSLYNLILDYKHRRISKEPSEPAPSQSSS